MRRVTNKHVPLKSDVVGYQHTFKHDFEFTMHKEPDRICCPGCNAEWYLLPGEYEAIIDSEITPSCPFCGYEGMEFAGSAITFIPIQ